MARLAIILLLWVLTITCLQGQRLKFHYRLSSARIASLNLNSDEAIASGQTYRLPHNRGPLKCEIKAANTPFVLKVDFWRPKFPDAPGSYTQSTPIATVATATRAAIRVGRANSIAGPFAIAFAYASARAVAASVPPSILAVSSAGRAAMRANTAFIFAAPFAIAHASATAATLTTVPLNENSPWLLYGELPIRNRRGDPTIMVRIPYRAWIVTANSLVLKVRPKVTVWDTDSKARSNQLEKSVQAGSINLGLSVGKSFGYTWFTHRGSTNWSLTPSAGLGFSAEAVKDASKTAEGLKSTGKKLVLSPSASVIIARNDIGLIFSYGSERMVGSRANSWSYQGRHFWGLGLSAGFKL